MKLIFIWILTLAGFMATGQVNHIKGQLTDDKGEAVAFANVVLYDQEGVKMLKAELSDLDGNFIINRVEEGKHLLAISFIGMEDKRMEVELTGSSLDLGSIEMINSGVKLETTVVTAKRAMVEVKADKTVFNVEGTINSAGDDVLGLLRKAPGVLLDNNNNISIMGRSGVLVYIDGKKLPLSGDELSNYLESIPSEQIDRFDIITNPGAKYEAEGNAGIIDIRLKKSKSEGTNGTITGAVSQGRHNRHNINLNGNSRQNKTNLFGNLGYNKRKGYHDIYFLNEQNGLLMDEVNFNTNDRRGVDGKLGLDVFLNDHHTVGVLYGTNVRQTDRYTYNRIEISKLEDASLVDSILVADNSTDQENSDQTFNINYVYNRNDKSLNVDADYGRFRKGGISEQPNTYWDPTEQMILSTYNTGYEAPVDIDIYSLKLDYEQSLAGGTLGLGSKWSRVQTYNTYLFYDKNGESPERVDSRSNIFDYDEIVYAAYASYNRKVGEKFSLSGGLRVEYTDVTGELSTFDPNLQEPPVLLNYPDYFPSFGISYQPRPKHSYQLNYSRRINRPDYDVLNPFREQQSELSFRKGNPFLDPEIVNNLELGYTYGYRYNAKISYSRTLNLITRLIGPDENDPRASFLSWDNLAIKDVYAINFALPFEFNSWWNGFFNLTGSYIDHQSDYGNGAVIDLQAWSYNLYSQQSFNLPGDLTAEVSGWFNGPGIWGGVFEYETSWSLNVGLQRKFFNKSLNVKLSADDLFYQSGWSGTSYFNGLAGTGRGYFDSRRVSLSMSYQFGNSKLKTRKRSTGLEEESKRISSGN